MTEDFDIDPDATPVAEWLDRLAQPHGAPGGGAASAVMAAICAGLLGMVSAYTPEDSSAEQATQRVGRIRREVTVAGERDGIHSAAFGAALAMDDGATRDQTIRRAGSDAAFSSLDIGRGAASLVPEARLLADIGNPNVRADLLVAVAALGAALDGAIITTRATLDILDHHRGVDDGLDPSLSRIRRGVSELERERAEVTSIALAG